MSGSFFLFRKLVPISALLVGSWIGLVGVEEAERQTHEQIDRAHDVIVATPYLNSAIEAVDRFIHSPQTQATIAPYIPKSDPQPPPEIDPSTLPDPAPFPRMNPNANVGRAWLLSEGPAYEANDNKRLVTLTFDDGPVPETTPAILRALEHDHVHATFFLIGRYLDGTDARAVATRNIAKEILSEGHMIGNHTHDHSLLTTANHAAALAQIEDGAASIERAIGRKPVFFRPPFGQLDPFTEDVLKKRDDEVVMWNVEVGDMINDDPDAMALSLEKQITNSGGGIVLLHDVRPSTVRTLPKLLAWLRAHRYDPARPQRVGYEIVDLPEYLRATAAHPQPYSDRAEVEEARKKVFREAHRTVRSES